MVADPDVGVFADEVVVDGAGEVGVDVGEGDVGRDADGVGGGGLVLVVESLVARLDEGDGDVTNLVDVGLDLNAGRAAAVAGDGDVAGLPGEVDASLGELWRRKRGERGWGRVSEGVFFPVSKRRKVEAFLGLVTLNRERIRAGGLTLRSMFWSLAMSAMALTSSPVKLAALFS